MNITDIRLIHAEKKRFLALLLLADEQESMIDRYLERGDLFVWFETPERPAAVAVMTAMDRPGVYELKNLAVRPDLQGKGYGKAFIDFLWSHYADAKEFWVGTGDSPSTRPFYERCGFRYSHRIAGFFTKNYDHPIVEDGVLLEDMIYLVRRRLNLP